MHSRPALLLLGILFVVACAPTARADPSENALDDALADGDIDREDRAAMRTGGHVGASDERDQSWVSVLGFGQTYPSGQSDVGALLVVGIAFDRIATGPVHRFADSTRPPKPLPLPDALPASTSQPSVPLPAPAASAAPPQDLVSPEVARQCVNAALIASGLGVDDSRIDALIGRARASAWLPETRMRAMRLWQDNTNSTTVATTDSASLYDAVGANLVMELRLTWRLDRLLYAGDEASLERVRLERLDARSRLATKTLEVLFSWERSTLESRRAISGSSEERDARIRAAEARATLDVLTGGWFGEAETRLDLGGPHR